MRFCFCNQPVFGTDKITKIGYCKAHQSLRTDTDKRTMMQKAMDKNNRQKVMVRSLNNYQREVLVDNLADLKAQLDYVYSRWLRIANAEKDLRVECYTCGKKEDFKKMQCGHFISRVNLGLRWENSNTKPQCKNCNEFLKGNIEVFSKKLEEEKNGIVEWLTEQSRIVYSPTRDELKELLINYTAKLRIVEKIKLIQ